MIYGHPVIAAIRALRFSDHVTKRNGGSGEENAIRPTGVNDKPLGSGCIDKLKNNA